MPLGRRLLPVIAIAPALLGATPTPASAPCPGDCDGSFSVSIDELVTGVNIALGHADVESCRAFDGNADGGVTVEELVRAVRHAADGCTDVLADAAAEVVVEAIDLADALRVIDPPLAVAEPAVGPIGCRTLFEPIDGAVPPPPGPPCPFRGNVATECIPDETARLGTTYRECRGYDPTTDNNVIRNGTATLSAPANALCPPAEIPDGPFRYDAELTLTLTNALNQTIERHAQDLQAEIASWLPCETNPEIAATISGTIHLFRACLGREWHYVLDDLEIRRVNDSPCAQPTTTLAGNATIETDAFSRELTFSDLRLEATSDARRVSGVVDSPSIGRITLETGEPLHIPGPGRPPESGSLQLEVRGRQLTVDFPRPP